jgi:uncharacterized protein
MSEQAGQTVIDSLEFARTGQTLRGRLPIPALTRLQDSLYDSVGRIDFMVQGGHDARNRPTLNLEVRGVLHLTCQRCLGHLDYPLQLGNTLLLASPAKTASDGLEENEAESIEPSAELDVARLVEDEIILELPYSPRHAEGACRSSRDPSAREVKETAFAKLATLKQNLD